MQQPRVLLTICALATGLLFAWTATAQGPPGQSSESADHARLKRNQIEQLLKQDREKSIEDAGEMMKLAEELKAELEKNDKTVLSVSALRKAEEIEKLAKRVKGRLRRY